MSIWALLAFLLLFFGLLLILTERFYLRNKLSTKQSLGMVLAGLGLCLVGLWLGSR